MKPSLLDPNFKYIASVKTDLHATFRRVRREMREAQEREREEARLSNVSIIAKKKEAK